MADDDAKLDSSEETSAAGGTSKSQDDTASQDDSRSDEKAEAGTSPMEGESPSDEKDGSDVDAIKGKMSALEKERNEAMMELKRMREESSRPRKLEFSAEEAQELDKRFYGNRSEYELWRQDKIRNNFEDPGPYEKVYAGYVPPEQRTGTQAGGVQTPQQPVDPSQLANEVKESIKFEEAFEGFVNSVPEIDPDRQETEADRERAQEKAMKLSRMAAVFKYELPNVSYGEALEIAWNSLPENRDKLIERAKEDGKMVGRHEAYAKGSGDTEGTSGSTPKGREDKITLTEEEKALAKASRVSEESVLEQKKRDLQRKQSRQESGVYE